MTLAIGSVEMSVAQTPSPAPSTSLAPSPHPLSTPMDFQGIPRFSKLPDSPVYRGGQPTNQAFGNLRTIGVKTIVDLRLLYDDRSALQGLGLRYVHIPCNLNNLCHGEIMKFLKVANDPQNQPIYVHDELGVDSVGVMIACYRTYNGWTAQEAITEMEQDWLDAYGPPVFHLMERLVKKANYTEPDIQKQIVHVKVVP
ncbi:MAG TPA: hypothetical protein VGO93_01935 [Candidatus Xenobia bacterium]